MCEFFSFVTKGNRKYFLDWGQRKELLKNNPNHLDPDSHTSICKFHSLDDDRVNKFEYNPLTREFTVDQINLPKDNRALAEKWVRNLDFKTIVEPLRLSDIIHPFEIEPPKITEEHIELLKLWDSVGAYVWASVRDSVGDSVGASVRDSVWDSVGDSVRDSVGVSVWDYVRDSVGTSVRDSFGSSVRDSVRDSVGASVWAYTSDFFGLDDWKYIDHKKGENPFNPCIELWKIGIVPSFDGEKWRLHTKNGIAWEGRL
jgi:hypothetical protein